MMTLDELKSRLAASHPQVAEQARLAFAEIEAALENLARLGHVLEVVPVEPPAPAPPAVQTGAPLGGLEEELPSSPTPVPSELQSDPSASLAEGKPISNAE